MSVSLRKEKKTISFKAIITILTVILMVPLLMLLILYYSNQAFKSTTHGVLEGLPGSAGEYFQAMPTAEEEEELKREIAKSYIAMEQERIADKLLLIRNEDQQLYNDLVIHLNRLNSRKMTTVQEIIRRNDIRDDLLVGLFDEMQHEENQEIANIAGQFTALDPIQAIRTIERNHRDGQLLIDELSKAFAVMNIEDAAIILAYLDESIKEQVMYQLPINLRRNVNDRINEIRQHQLYLIELSTYYENQLNEDALGDIGDDQQFSMEDLAAIYRVMSLEKGAQLLSTIEDREFKLSLYESINQLEKLMGYTPNTAELLAKGTQAYKDYDIKTTELTDIYQRMNRSELADLMERMWTRNQVFNQIELTTTDTIVFNERMLVVDVLNKLRTNVVAELMELMEPQRVTEISQALIS
ncbi:hypothetical protein Amet_2720 [Alkaliphilus metalliredigens QYMF]|uniref:Uncharacterized protein n=1 Tax=Alkaliphilus metalliredigens (strain QYMF) TaxID=293826 RepID=A6TRQ4_ALKMQ|nr:hypothetical protein [Alkaliphilus metalliredigens]ABR48872.1 hypothetical protein Amet_2720 [Alkaliphilus metalliredigens QYMF]